MSESTRVSARVWMQRLRDDPNITKVRLATLLTLGTYLDSDGSNGRVRESTIAGAVGITERAVRDHLADARADGYLNRSARGHRLGDGTVSASTYEATVPDTSTGTGVPVEDDVNRNPDAGRDSSQPEPGRVSTGTGDVLNRNLDVSQPEPGCSAYKERPTTDQVPDQKQTKGGARESAPPPAAEPKPSDGMLPMPVVVTSPSKPPRRPAARPKPKKPLTGHTATAARLVDAWWEHQHPKPTNYMAVRSAVVACLEAGWAEDRIPQALDDVAASPYPVRAGTLETALKRRSNPARPAAGGNVHHLDRRAQNATAWAQEAAIAAGADPGDPFTTSNFFATTAADPNVIDGEIIRGTA